MDATPTLPRDFTYRDPRAKSPALAILLSAFPGLGQVYVGYTGLGFIHMAVVASLITALSLGLGGLEPLFGLFLPFTWLYSMIDAGRRAAFVNAALAGLATGQLPEGFETQDRKAALLGGVLLIVIGLLSLAHMLFGLSFHWLERWWPLVLVLVGAGLVTRNLPRRAAASGEAE